MSQSNVGIQRLLEAEKKASARVAEARKIKVQRLKAAKKEADHDINKCKTEKETQFKVYEQEIMKNKGSSEAQIQVQTNQKLKDQEAMMKHNKAKTIQTILQNLFSIEVRLHENVRL